MTKIEKTDAEWRAELDPEQYRVLRQKGTEAPFTGEYDHVFEPGTYTCAGCGAELFESDTKYDSGCGWPAFYAPTGDDAIDEETDVIARHACAPRSCARTAAATSGTCSPTAPQPTGQRYCINSAALKLEREVGYRSRTAGTGGSPCRLIDSELARDAHVRQQLRAVGEREAAARRRVPRAAATP